MLSKFPYLKISSFLTRSLRRHRHISSFSRHQKDKLFAGTPLRILIPVRFCTKTPTWSEQIENNGSQILCDNIRNPRLQFSDLS